jgi:hypothetical protein
MSNTIQKPDANPIVAALLTWFLLGTGHWLINGQQRKWIFILVSSLVWSLACCLPGIVVSVLSIIDAYKTAERLQKGETIGENEYTMPLLFKMVRFFDKTATCSTVTE